MRRDMEKRNEKKVHFGERYERAKEILHRKHREKHAKVKVSLTTL